MSNKARKTATKKLFRARKMNWNLMSSILFKLPHVLFHTQTWFVSRLLQRISCSLLHVMFMIASYLQVNAIFCIVYMWCLCFRLICRWMQSSVLFRACRTDEDIAQSNISTRAYFSLNFHVANDLSSSAVFEMTLLLQKIKLLRSSKICSGTALSSFSHIKAIIFYSCAKVIITNLNY